MQPEPPTITDWITAISTVVLGITGAVFAIYQWFKAGFQPVVSAYIDATRKRIVVMVENHGRGSGVVTAIGVVNGPCANAESIRSSVVAAPAMAQFPQSVLGPGAVILVVLEAVPAEGTEGAVGEPAKFPDCAHVYIRRSGTGGDVIKPTEVTDADFSSTISQLPPR